MCMWIIIALHSYVEPCTLSLMNLSSLNTVSGPCAPSGQSDVKWPNTKKIILWLWLSAAHSSSSQGLWLLYWVFFQSGFLLLVLRWDFWSYLFSSGFQAHAGRGAVVQGRPRFRPGIRSLVFRSQLCLLLVAWL